MTQPVQVTTRRQRSRFAAILVYTLQSCIPPRRWVALLLPCAGALLFGLLAHAVNGSAEHAFANVAAEGIFALVMPIAALVIGDSVLGAEVRAGTFHFTWLSPAATWQIVLGRWLGGSLVAVVTIAPASALAAVIAGAPTSAGPAFVAAAVGSGLIDTVMSVEDVEPSTLHSIAQEVEQLAFRRLPGSLAVTTLVVLLLTALILSAAAAPAPVKESLSAHVSECPAELSARLALVHVFLQRRQLAVLVYIEAREQRQHIDDVLFGLVFDRYMLVHQSTMQGITEVLREICHWQHRA